MIYSSVKPGFPRRLRFPARVRVGPISGPFGAVDIPVALDSTEAHATARQIVLGLGHDLLFTPEDFALAPLLEPCPPPARA